MSAGADTQDATPTRVLWERLHRPFRPAAAVEAVLGLPAAAARQYVGGVLATSDEVEELLDRFHHIVRSLAVSTASRPQRCHGEIRGPVLWGETVGARSATAGDPGLFVCARPEKAYDTLENQVLTAALRAARDAARDAEALPPHDYDDDVLRRARHNGHRAVAALEHRALVDVSVTAPTGRALRRARSGHRRRVYGPALDVLDRAAQAVTADHVAHLADRRTVGHHALALAALGALERRTGARPRLRVDHGDLVAGPLRARHPALGAGGRPTGVSIAGTPIDGGALDGGTLDAVVAGLSQPAVP